MKLLHYFGIDCKLWTHFNNKLCHVRHKNGLVIGLVKIVDEDSVTIEGVKSTAIKKEDILECRRVKWIQKR